ncbi:ABC transporter permease [Aureimonas altamirensis]|uniref:ABC transporter permease n=1 Tax=Aureimonas altamirensis TaxID=370622 RepID=UPI0020366DC4|nr:ABC transporter permease [Aureimonas altamirensis]MCM2505795.1 ABC transporter permease [Aureimonas altamirensis]
MTEQRNTDRARAFERREHLLMSVLALPAFAVVFLLLLVPLAWLLFQSFWDGGPSLNHYIRLFSDPVYFNTFVLTFRISFIVTVVTLLLAYPVAYAATVAKGKWRALILAFVLVPFWTSVLVRAYAWLILLQRSGIVNSTLRDIGLIERPLSLVHNELGTIIATVHILLPFMILPLQATMARIPRDLLTAGSSLGGSPFHVFRRVFLPLSLPGILAGCTLVFVLCLGFYITPELMGGGRTVMVSMVISRNIELYQAWGAASAVSVVLLAIVGAIFWTVSRFLPLDRVFSTR